MNSIDKNKLPFRQGVIGAVIDKNNNFLLIKSVQYGENDRRFAGGGIDEGENSKEALLRELEEELGTDKFKIIKRSKYINEYDWEDEVIKRHNNKWRGQQQIQYLVEFEGERKDIKQKKGEIRKAKWVTLEELLKYLDFRNQWKLASKVIEEFNL